MSTKRVLESVSRCGTTDAENHLKEAIDPKTFSASYTLDPDVICEHLEDRIVLVHLRSNRIFELSATASRFCDLLLSGRTPSECLAVLEQEFSASRELLQGEVARLLSTLSEQEITRLSG